MDVQTFIKHWSDPPISERAQYQSFVHQLCTLLSVPAPDDLKVGDRDYTFERPILFRHDDGSNTPGYIDCYRKGCFVLEAKQSKKRLPGGALAPQLALTGGKGPTKTVPAGTAARMFFPALRSRRAPQLGCFFLR